HQLLHLASPVMGWLLRVAGSLHPSGPAGGKIGGEARRHVTARSHFGPERVTGNAARAEIRRLRVAPGTEAATGWQSADPWCTPVKSFLSFRLDPLNHCSWQGEARVSVSPKAFDLLRYLMERPGRLVSQQEILEALWPQSDVNPEIIKKYILGLRKVL